MSIIEKKAVKVFTDVIKAAMKQENRSLHGAFERMDESSYIMWQTVTDGYRAYRLNGILSEESFDALPQSQEPRPAPADFNRFFRKVISESAKELPIPDVKAIQGYMRWLRESKTEDRPISAQDGSGSSVMFAKHMPHAVDKRPVMIYNFGDGMPKLNAKHLIQALELFGEGCVIKWKSDIAPVLIRSRDDLGECLLMPYNPIAYAECVARGNELAEKESAKVFYMWGREP